MISVEQALSSPLKRKSPLFAGFKLKII